MVTDRAEDIWRNYKRHVPDEMRRLAVTLTDPMLRVFTAAKLEPPEKSGWLSVWLDGEVIASLEPKARVVGLALRMDPIGQPS